MNLLGLIWTPDVIASALVFMILLVLLIWSIHSERKRERDYDDLQ